MDFFESLKYDFIAEAEEYLKIMQSELLRLENLKNYSNLYDELEEIYRTTHSLKGAARSVNLPLIEQLCISLEELWKNARNGTLILDAKVFDVANEAVDVLHRLLEDVKNNSSLISAFEIDQMRLKIEKLSQPSNKFTGLLNSLTSDPLQRTLKNQYDTKNIENDEYEHKEIEKDDSIVTNLGSIPKKEIKESTREFIRIPFEKIKNLLIEVEEIISFDNNLNYLQNEINECLEEAWKFIKNSDTKNATEKNYFSEFLKKLDAINRNLLQLKHSFSLQTKSVIEHAQDIIMFPIANIFDILPRMVRDISHAKGKNVRLKLNDNGVEVDKRIVEGLKEPLIHIVRNCIDHGIEYPEVRMANGKIPEGTISISAVINSEGKLQLEIEDDGAGIDLEKVKQKSIKKNFITIDQIEKLSQQDIVQLIFKSGLSTSDEVNEISGHGLGMTIVANQVEKLGGSIAVFTEQNKGTTFKIILPRILSFFKGILIKEGEMLLIIPIQFVSRVMLYPSSKIRYISSTPIIDYNEMKLPLVNLSSVLHKKDEIFQYRTHKNIQIIILQNNNKCLALQVQQIIGQEVGIVRSLDGFLTNHPLFSGALMLGTGKLSFVLKIDPFFNLTIQTESNRTFSVKKNILVVDDSLTVRNILRNYLEASGYEVTIAQNGIEALKKLNEIPIDAVITDIDMPSMNGLELTKKIRQEKKWEYLPVVIISSLDSEVDRIKGLKSGANAYISKGNFEKGELLNILNSLIP